jgi:hypothetical protein
MVSFVNIMFEGFFTHIELGFLQDQVMIWFFVYSLQGC